MKTLILAIMFLGILFITDARDIPRYSADQIAAVALDFSPVCNNCG
jgi:hypothetical protein